MTEQDKEKFWDREMAEVDRLLKKLPTYDPAGPSPTSGPTARRSGATASQPPAAGSGAAAWARVALGVALALGMTVWPYRHVCGIKLFLYMGGILTLIVAGAWGAVSAWRHRRALAHVISLVVVLWGLMLAAGVVLPRVGYTGVEAWWFCPEPPELGPR